MNEKNLPVHPRTGLTAIGLRADGRAIWPALGADENGDAAVVTRLGAIDTELETVRTGLLEFAELTELDDAQATRFAELETRHTELTAEREPLAHRAEVIERVRTAQRTGNGVERTTGAPNYSQRVQPYADLENVVNRSLGLTDLHSRALAAIENAGSHLSDDARERAESLIRTSDRRGRIARHMLLTGSDAYQRAFEDLLGGLQPWQLDQDAQRALAIADAHRRAINEGTGAAGGFLVPFHLDPTIILTNAGSSNPFRAISRVDTITTNEWHGVTSAGVTAGYRGEGVEADDDSPSFDQPEVPIVGMDAYVQATFESMEDTNVASSIGMLLADAKDNLEAAEMAVGDGAAGHLTGVITGLVAAGGSSVVKTATAATLAVDDIYEVHDSIADRWLANASWVAHRKIQSKFRQFATGTGQNTGAFWATLGQGLPPQLLGESIRHASGMDSTVATGKNIAAFGDFKRGYLIVDRIGMTVHYNPLVIGPNGRPTGEAGWFARWRSGANVIVPDAIHALQVL